MESRRSRSKLKSMDRSHSTESTEYSLTMGKSMRKKKPKERWLLTRKTWRYMADAGRKLIPDGAQNRPEDVPKIEAYFQEVCRKEPKFLLWRKNSYPGALGFRKKRKVPPKGGSCRKATSADQIETFFTTRPTDLQIQQTSTGKFDLKKMKEEFLNKPPTPTDYSRFDLNRFESTDSLNEDPEERQLCNMLEKYLTLAKDKEPSTQSRQKYDFNYQELIDKLQKHLNSISHQYKGYSTPSYNPGHVSFQGDHVQKSLSETLSRYYSSSGSRDKIISDLLTDRKALENLYFNLRKTKGFRGSRGGTGYTSAYGCRQSDMANLKSNLKSIPKSYDKPHEPMHPPPLIEIENETFEIVFRDRGIQTLPISNEVLRKCEEEYKKVLAEREEEEYGYGNKPNRRRSSVDNDDVSQSVSDTIKRYLRMARKKSVDTDKADRFKRVNYDRNLRNIKAKGEITKPGDDDGLNKGCQTNEEWITTYRDLEFDEYQEISDVESVFSSSRSSIDIGTESNPNSPPPTKSSSHSFLSNLLHGKGHDKNAKDDKNSAAAMAARAMQKSKSSSSVIHHGGKLTKKIFRSRSKSSTRASHGQSSWTPQGSCMWTNGSGRTVVLSDTSLLHLSEIERKLLQKVALAKIQALNLGCTVKVPTETVGVATKPKRKPYLIKRKAITTSIFDNSRKENDKDGGSSLVFGIPLTQCVENDRLVRAAAGTSPFRSRGELSHSADETTIGRQGSRSSFSSLMGDNRGSCESLTSKSRLVGSVPGLLDQLSGGSMADITGGTAEEECSVPNILCECIRHLEQNGMHTLGIFRVSTSKKRVRELREDFDCGKETSLDNETCPHDVATLLKEFLRDLPDPLLCRDLYQAFVQTQKIRNRRLQLEALQHLVQLLPPANRDTLFALLGFLANVSKYSNDYKNEEGEMVSGNKMDTNNLATVFAPNILHCIKPGSKDIMADKPEERIDIINVIRTLIEQYKNVYSVPAELLHEVYVHMMDSNPECLDQLLIQKDIGDESVDELDSESSSVRTPTKLTPEMSIDFLIDQEAKKAALAAEPKKTYSRGKFLHEAAATGGPDVGMRRHKDRIRERSERSLRRRRDESAARKKSNEEPSGISSAISLISRLRTQKDDEKGRSSSIESTSSTHTDGDVYRTMRLEDERRKSSPYILDNSGVITASLTIPVQNQSMPYDDIPYIEDDTGKQHLTIGLVRTPTAPPRKRQQSLSSDSSLTSNIGHPVPGSVSMVHSIDSAMGSSATYSSPLQNTPSVTSSLADASMYSSPPSWASSPPTSPDSQNKSVNYIPDEYQLQKSPRVRTVSSSKEPLSSQKVSFANIQNVQRVGHNRERRTSESVEPSKREPKFTASISNIGSAVLKSKTADFEKIIKVEAKSKEAGNSDREKKKYTKRRYTDSRHQTRHIPDSNMLESSSNAPQQPETSPNLSQAGPFYKRREIIASVPNT